MYVLSIEQYSRVNRYLPYISGMPKTAENLTTFGARIRYARLKRGLTQVQLAIKAGIGQSALSTMETNDTKTTFAGTLLRLAVALDVEPLWLESGRGPPEPNPTYDPADYHFSDVLSALNATNRRSLLIIGQAMLADQLSPAPDLSVQFANFPSRRPRKDKKATV